MSDHMDLRKIAKMTDQERGEMYDRQRKRRGENRLSWYTILATDADQTFLHQTWVMDFWNENFAHKYDLVQMEIDRETNAGFNPFGLIKQVTFWMVEKPVHGEQDA